MPGIPKVQNVIEKINIFQNYEIDSIYWHRYLLYTIYIINYMKLSKKIKNGNLMIGIDFSFCNIKHFLEIEVETYYISYLRIRSN